MRLMLVLRLDCWGGVCAAFPGMGKFMAKTPEMTKAAEVNPGPCPSGAML
jgi:hypothetical protein